MGCPLRCRATRRSSRRTWELPPMLLELRDVRVHYGKIEALKGVSLEVEKGEIVTLIGANGAGKTTTLKTISGLRNCTSGAVLLNGRDISRMPGHRRAARGNRR